MMQNRALCTVFHIDPLFRFLSGKKGPRKGIRTVIVL